MVVVGGGLRRRGGGGGGGWRVCGARGVGGGRGSGGGLTYRDAGVDIEAGAELVRRIQKLNPSIGGFGGLFPLGDSYLVAGCDGVGTKLMLGFETNAHRTIGQDLVAMSVNDIVTTGAKPLFFLDYFGTGALDVDVAQMVVEGISDACERSDCLLLGGETAEMPDFYNKGEYDLSGFAVGIVKKNEVIDGSNIRSGDVLLGIPSTGVHSNGFSLVRKYVTHAARPTLLIPTTCIVLDVSGTSLSDIFTDGFGGEKTVGEVLVAPTALYPRLVLEAKETFPGEGILGMAHITGGGFTENIPRILPAGLGAAITLHSWDMHPIFPWLQQVGEIPDDEMYKTFNMGIGMVLIVRPETAAEVVAGGVCAGSGMRAIGKVEEDPEKRVRYISGDEL